MILLIRMANEPGTPETTTLPVYQPEGRQTPEEGIAPSGETPSELGKKGN
jgi:hypothetical protein